MSIKKRVVYYGYLAKGMLPILKQMQHLFHSSQIEFLIFFTAINSNDVDNQELEDLEYINFDQYYFLPYESFFDLVKADFFILWGGYDGVLAHYRNFMINSGIPHLLCEYTGIENLFHFSSALNGESEFASNLKQLFLKPTLVDYDRLLSNRIECSDIPIDLLHSIKQEYDSVISYFAMWDWAAGLNEVNSTTTQAYISKYYLSSYAALVDLYSNLPPNALLLIKSHPHDSTENKLLFDIFADQRQNVINLTHNSTAAQMIEISDVVCTIASTVNFIALYQKKPLVLLGKTYISTSQYPYQIDEYPNLFECLKAAINKEEWDKRLNERVSFLSNFLLNAEVFSNDEVLIQHGVKSIKQLSNLIISQFNERTNIHSVHPPFHALTKRLLIEIKGINDLLSDRTLQLGNTLTELENTRTDLIERTQRLGSTENLLAERTYKLRSTEAELLERTVALENTLTELEQTRTELIERTQRLVNAENELVEGAYKLESTKTELAERTVALENTLGVLEQTRTDLIKRTQRLECTEDMQRKYKKAKFIIKGRIIF